MLHCPVLGQTHHLPEACHQGRLLLPGDASCQRRSEAAASSGMCALIALLPNPSAVVGDCVLSFCCFWSSQPTIWQNLTCAKIEDHGCSASCVWVTVESVASAICPRSVHDWCTISAHVHARRQCMCFSAWASESVDMSLSTLEQICQQEFLRGGDQLIAPAVPPICVFTNVSCSRPFGFMYGSS